MKANRGKHTKPEVAVRRMLHGMGYRFRLHRTDLPGTPDIVFPSRKAVIQVHGCFWHQHAGCRRSNIPATRQDYWLPKLARNEARDIANDALLETMGWKVLTLWECETVHSDVIANRCVAFLGIRPMR